MAFRKCDEQDDVPSSVTLLGHQIEYVRNTKYFRIMLTVNSSIKADIDRVLDGVYSKLLIQTKAYCFFCFTRILYHSTELIPGACLDQHIGSIRYPYRLTKM